MKNATHIYPQCHTRIESDPKRKQELCVDRRDNAGQCDDGDGAQKCMK